MILTEKRPLIAILTTAILLSSTVVITQIGNFFSNPEFGIALSVDLLITIPLIYFFLIRKTQISKLTVIPVLILGIVIGTLFLPTKDQFLIDQFKFFLLPIIEVTVLSLVIYRVVKVRKRYKTIAVNDDFQDRLKVATTDILPEKVAPIFITEIGMMYYSLFTWKKRKLAANEWTYHKETGSQAIYGAVILMVVAELFGLHLLISQWSTIAAWILSLLSFYSLLQILSIAKSLQRRPIVIEEQQLILRYGNFMETTIDLSEIEEVELTKKDVDDKEVKALSPLIQLEGHNLVLHVKNEQLIHGLYGIKRTYRKLRLTVDQPEAFKKAIEAALLKGITEEF